MGIYNQIWACILFSGLSKTSLINFFDTIGNQSHTS